MAILISSEDLRLISQPTVRCTLKADIVNNDGTVLASIKGLIDGGTVSVSAGSDVRRTASISIVPSTNESIKVTEDSNIWLSKHVKLSVGIRNMMTGEDVWYKLGSYIFMNTSLTYDAQTNQIVVQCSDFMSLLDGTRNGTIGALTTTIPAYEEDTVTGEIIEHNYIRKAMAQVLSQLGRVNEYLIDDIGEYKGIESRNPEGYEEYRRANPTWNSVPYDLEFSVGDTVLSIITTLRDLNPFYEAFFNVDNVFICQSIPTLLSDDVVLTNDQLQKVLLADNTENTSLDFTEVKNISEVWGKLIEPDFYAEVVTNSSGVYKATIDGYEEDYASGDIISLKIPADNVAGQKININSFGAISIYNGEAIKLIKAGELIKGKVYCFKIQKDRNNGTTTTKAVLMGLYQPHALSVLLSSESHERTYTTVTLVTFSGTRSVVRVLDDYSGLGLGELADYVVQGNFSGNVYQANNNNLSAYHYGDSFLLLSHNECPANPKLSINGLSSIPIVNEEGEKLSSGVLLPERHYYLKIKKQKVDGESIMCAVVYGEYAFSFIEPYSEQYFKDAYGVNVVERIINPESPFTVEKIGEVLTVEQTDNVTTDELALSQAHYTNWKCSRLTDNITITTLFMPFLDVNVKVEYKPKASEEVNQYIIDSLSHDMTNGTTSITMHRFYPLYENF